MVQKSSSSQDQLQEAAQRAQKLIRGKGDYGHVTVQAKGKTLVVKSEGDPTAKLSHLSGNIFGLSFCAQSGKWEKMPHSGPLEKVVDDMVQTLAPYLVKIPF